MKNTLLIVISLVFVGCSSGNSGGSSGAPGPADKATATAFENKTSGTWVSACTQSQKGPFVETLVINKGGTGSFTFNFYQNQDCTGAVNNTDGPTQFTYQVLTAAKIKLTVAGQGAFELTVEINNNNMSVTAADGTMNYTRIGNAPGVTPAPGNNDFDTTAKGNWVTEQCYQYENNTTVRVIISIYGQGKAAMVYNVYQSANCSGQAQAQNKQDFNYVVDRFSNGGGQITVNGEPSDVIFANGKMTLNSAQGSTVYVKLN